MAAQRIAVLAPGGGYTVQGPLLAYARLAAERRGADVRPIDWRIPEDFDDSPQQRFDLVNAQVAETLGDDNALLIGKSLGSLSAPLATERALPAIWLTPLLKLPEVVEAIQAADEHPPLLIGGDADGQWNGPVARRISPHVLEIPDADHALYVPGPVSATAAVAGLVADAIEAFLDTHVWPS
jgi:pimeloyl-ACP methyl ester carboxylesterase